MHKGYKCVSKLEIELKQLEKTAMRPINQGAYNVFSIVLYRSNSLQIILLYR